MSSENKWPCVKCLSEATIGLPKCGECLSGTNGPIPATDAVRTCGGVEPGGIKCMFYWDYVPKGDIVVGECAVDKTYWEGSFPNRKRHQCHCKAERREAWLAQGTQRDRDALELSDLIGRIMDVCWVLTQWHPGQWSVRDQWGMVKGSGATALQALREAAGKGGS